MSVGTRREGPDVRPQNSARTPARRPPLGVLSSANDSISVRGSAVRGGLDAERFDANDTGLTEANLAWDRGDYISALTGYLKLLTSPDSDALVEPIALQTGELFTTTELTR